MPLAKSIIIILFSFTCIITVTASERKSDNKEYFQLQNGHSKWVSSVKFSPDGKNIATGSIDGTIRLWTIDGKLLRVLSAQSGNYDCISFTPDSKFLISGDSGNNIIIWRVTDGVIIKKWKPGKQGSDDSNSMGVKSISFYSRKNIFAVSSSGDISLWDMNGTFLGRIETKSDIESIQFCDDGEKIVAGSNDGYITIWTIRGKKKWSVKAHDDFVKKISINKRGILIASTSFDGAVRLWNMNGEFIRKIHGDAPDQPLEDNSSDPLSDDDGISVRELKPGAWITDCEFSPDNKYIAVVSNTNFIYIYTVDGSPVMQIPAHDTIINDIEYSPDGSMLCSGSNDSSVKLWTSVGGKLAVMPGQTANIKGTVFNRDGSIVSWYQNGRIKIWKSDGILDKDFTVNGNPDSSYMFQFTSASISSDGKKISILGSDNKIYTKLINRNEAVTCSDYYSNDPYSQKTSEPDREEETGDDIEKHSITDMVYSSSGDLILARGDFLQIINPDNSSIESGLYENGSINKIKTSNNGKLIVSMANNIFSLNQGLGINLGPGDPSVKIWTNKGKLIATLYGHKGQVVDASFSMDDRLLATASYDGTVRIWNMDTKKEVAVMNVSDKTVDAVAFSYDGRMVVTGSNDGMVMLWDISGKVLRSFPGHSSLIHQVSFSADDNFILSSSADETFRIWEKSTGGVTVFTSIEDDFIMYTPDGLWDGSRHCGRSIAMVSGMDCWSIDQFAIKNNRPDLILAKLPNPDRKLISEYNRQYKKRIAKLEKLYGIKESDLSSEMHVPKAEILKAVQNGKSLNLSIKLTDSQYDIVSYNVYVNDVPVYTEIGKKINRDKDLSVTETIELTAGENKIEVSCFNAKGAESYRALTLANYDGRQKGNLYYIGFGVSDYSDGSVKDLKYAENDVLDLADKFSAMKNDYDKINIKTYTGKEVTAANIRGAKDFLKNAGVDDTVILFISGHGMHDSDEFKTYYYLTQNTDMNNLKGTAADFDMVEDILAGINPRKKLFLMDTCDSGELDDFAGKKLVAYDNKNGDKGIPRTPKGIVVEYADKRGYFDRSRYIYNDLFRRTGAVVFSSSKGGEVSWEYDSLKNGAFTEAMLEGLSGRADTDNNGRVTVDELQDYVSKGVINYTDSKQHPVIDRDNIYVKIELPVR